MSGWKWNSADLGGHSTHNLLRFAKLAWLRPWLLGYGICLLLWGITCGPGEGDAAFLGEFQKWRDNGFCASTSASVTGWDGTWMTGGVPYKYKYLLTARPSLQTVWVREEGPTAVALKLGGLVKRQVAGPLPCFADSWCLRCGQRMCISNKFPGDVAAGVETTLWELGSYSKGRIRKVTPEEHMWYWQYPCLLPVYSPNLFSLSFPFLLCLIPFISLPNLFPSFLFTFPFLIPNFYFSFSSSSSFGVLVSLPFILSSPPSTSPWDLFSQQKLTSHQALNSD